jgi:hypothetical protein
MERLRKKQYGGTGAVGIGDVAYAHREFNAESALKRTEREQKIEENAKFDQAKADHDARKEKDEAVIARLQVALDRTKPKNEGHGLAEEPPPHILRAPEAHASRTESPIYGSSTSLEGIKHNAPREEPTNVWGHIWTAVGEMADETGDAVADLFQLKRTSVYEKAVG